GASPLTQTVPASLDTASDLSLLFGRGNDPDTENKECGRSPHNDYDRGCCGDCPRRIAKTNRVGSCVGVGIDSVGNAQRIAGAPSAEPRCEIACGAVV